VDCEEIARFERMDARALGKIFTEREIAYCSGKARPSQHFAARFAAKEAVIKCLGSLGKRVFLNQIEIANRKNGSPFVILNKKLSRHDISVSLSHSGGMAIAFAIARKGGKNG
jgi:holo-[acyl-carrier protein] synthase